MSAPARTESPGFGRRWRAEGDVRPDGPILIVGPDDESGPIRRALERAWPDGPAHDAVADVDAAIARVKASLVHAVVLCALPDTPLDGMLAALTAGDDVPPIVVVGCASGDAALEAVRQGAHEALVGRRPDSAVLRHALRCAAARHAGSAALRAQAVSDPLTGLSNRLGLLDRLAHAVASARRRAAAVAVLFIDLDGFKRVNDDFGHDAGDRVLREIGRRLVTRTRDADTVARLGGDEFVVVMEHLEDARHAATMAAKILDLIRVPIALGVPAIELGASIGISVCPEDGVDGADLLRQADAAMYVAKAAGKDRIRYASTRLHDDVDARDRLDAMLRRAFDGGELELHYQPRWHAGDRRVAGCEALLRWRRPDLGVVAPAEFLPGAETSGAIVEIGRWVLREACQQARRLADAGFDLTVAVNVSVRQLAEQGFALDVSRQLEAAGLTAASLQVEVPEAALVEASPAVRTTLDALRALGVPLIVDHFGTGHSSLAALPTAPVHGLKIDGRVVRAAAETPHGPALPGAIVALARHLHLDVIAEGVETEAQVQQLRAAGCELMQGYYYGHALPAAELMAYLRWACTAVVGSDGPVRPEPGEMRRGWPRLVTSSPELPVPAGLLAARAATGRVVAGRFGPSRKS